MDPGFKLLLPLLHGRTGLLIVRFANQFSTTRWGDHVSGVYEDGFLALLLGSTSENQPDTMRICSADAIQFLSVVRKTLAKLAVFHGTSETEKPRW